MEEQKSIQCNTQKAKKEQVKKRKKENKRKSKEHQKKLEIGNKNDHTVVNGVIEIVTLIKKKIWNVINYHSHFNCTQSQPLHIKANKTNMDHY